MTNRQYKYLGNVFSFSQFGQTCQHIMHEEDFYLDWDFKMLLIATSYLTLSFLS